MGLAGLGDLVLTCTDDQSRASASTRKRKQRKPKRGYVRVNTSDRDYSGAALFRHTGYRARDMEATWHETRYSFYRDIHNGKKRKILGNHTGGNKNL